VCDRALCCTAASGAAPSGWARLRNMVGRMLRQDSALEGHGHAYMDKRHMHHPWCMPDHVNVWCGLCRPHMCACVAWPWPRRPAAPAKRGPCRIVGWGLRRDSALRQEEQGMQLQVMWWDSPCFDHHDHVSGVPQIAPAAVAGELPVVTIRMCLSRVGHAAARSDDLVRGSDEALQHCPCKVSSSADPPRTCTSA
jgi:hypothetical protein